MIGGVYEIMSPLTWIRIAVSCSMVAAVVIGVVQLDGYSAYKAIMTSLIFSAVPLLLAATESEELPPEARVPRNAVVAALAAPWLPGGGRGALFLILHLLTAYSAVWCFHTSLGSWMTKVHHVGMTCLSGTVFVLGPCAVAGRALRKQPSRDAMRVVIPTLLLVATVLSAFLEGARDSKPQAIVMQMLSAEAMGQWVGVARSHAGYTAHVTAVIALAALGALAIAGNAPRMHRGVREVVERSRGT